MGGFSAIIGALSAIAPIFSAVSSIGGLFGGGGKGGGAGPVPQVDYAPAQEAAKRRRLAGQAETTQTDLTRGQPGSATISAGKLGDAGFGRL